jgi:putative transposase
VIQRQLKLRLNKGQEARLNEWLWHLTGVHNWASRKIELDARDRIFHSRFDFMNSLAGHGPKLGIPSHTLQAVLAGVHATWSRRFKKLIGKPRLKGNRNQLNSIPFSDPLPSPNGASIAVPGLGRLRFHQMLLPVGVIKCGRLVKRASGWHLCLFIDAEPNPIPQTANGAIGIDPGFSSLLTLSNGEKIEHPRELEASAQRLAQAQRGHDRKLAARISERIANQRKDRNHKLSRRLVAENAFIAFSADRHKAVARRFGKSVASSSHYQLRQMLDYKCRAGGRTYVEVDPKNSTRTCSACGALSGPSGLAGLSVRHWDCAECGTPHDRDVNAAVNTLNAAAGMAVEIAVKASPKSPKARFTAGSL